MIDSRASQAAEQLEAAAIGRWRVEPLTDRWPDMDARDGYAVQARLIARKLDAGERLTGAKLGLVSRAKQQEMGIYEPIRGWLTDRMRLNEGQPLLLDGLAQPRAEPEIAFVMGRDLSGPGVTEEDVVTATASVHTAIEVLDSRFAGYRFRLPDVVADNSSAAYYVIASEGAAPAGMRLDLLGCVFEKNDEIVATAAGAAVLGNPARAVAWLVNELAADGLGLHHNDVVLSGGLTGVTTLSATDLIRVTIDRLGTLEMRCVLESERSNAAIETR